MIVKGIPKIKNNLLLAEIIDLENSFTARNPTSC